MSSVPKQKLVIRVQVPPDRNYAFSVEVMQSLSASMETICKKINPPHPFTKYTLCFQDSGKTIAIDVERPFGEQVKEPMPEFQLQLLPQYMAEEVILSMQTSDAKILKDCMFKLKNMFNDEHFTEAFIEQDGISMLISVVVDVKGSTQAYGLQALRSIMVYESALSKFTDTRELTEKLLPLLESKTTSVTRQALELLIVICDNCGFKLIHDAIKCTARYAGLEPYESFISLLGSGDLDTKVNCLTLMNALLHRAPNRQKATKLQRRWEKLGLLGRLRQNNDIKANEYLAQLALFKDNTNIDLSEEAAVKESVAAEALANISPFLSEYEAQQPRVLLLREELHRMHSTFYEAVSHGGYLNVFGPAQRYDKTTNILSQEPLDHPVDLSILDQLLNWDPSQLADPDSVSPRIIFTCTPLSQKYEPTIDHSLAPIDEAIPEVPFTALKDSVSKASRDALDASSGASSFSRPSTQDKEVQAPDSETSGAFPSPPAHSPPKLQVSPPSVSITVEPPSETPEGPSSASKTQDGERNDSLSAMTTLGVRKPHRTNSIGRQGLGARMSVAQSRDAPSLTGVVFQGLLTRADAALEPPAGPTTNARLSARLSVMHVPTAVPGPPPPPPLPIGISAAPGAPPPPPPPMGVPSMTAPKPTKNVVKPNTTMKPLHWKRILNHPATAQRADAVPTLWESIKEPEVDVAALENLFKMKAAEAMITNAKAAANKPTDVRRVLDPKRGYTIGIRMARLPTIEVILEGLANLDENKLTVEDLQGLLSCAPTPEEMEMITAAQGEELPLDKPEQFLIQINKIQRLEDRIKCWMTKRTFRETIDAVGRPLVILQRACKETKNSQALRIFLGVVLSCGNYMNGGNTARGQADGFHLSNLSLLSTVKDSTNSSNLLQFIVNQVKERYPEGMKLPEELSLAKEASTVSLSTITNDLQKVIKDLNVTRALAEGVISNVPKSDPFVLQIPRFLAEADKQLSNIQKQLSDTTQSFQDMLLFFGISRQQLSQESSDEYFLNLSNFVVSFKQFTPTEEKPKPKIIGRKIGGVQRDGEDPMAAVVQSIRLNIAQRATKNYD
eukprot:TRINITY_DN4293_c0_g1_i1.p1 TRINITY_DN4293_c0_g1~~TRINITY_DN4293_c0_g1_i1.p1  ORF type:complete len:1072 (-),score=269.95 TRINITY_DN4293_c0_g1_i1:143-3358(-)